MNGRPFLSVVTPTFNRRTSLERTIEALCRQTYPPDDFEQVVVSDGGTDDTMETLQKIGPSLPFQIKAIGQPNGGASSARNRGVDEARGEVIVFLDDDIEPAAHFLERHAMHHKSADDIVILGPANPDPASSKKDSLWVAWEHEQLQKTYNLFRPGGPYAGRPAGPMHFYSGNVSLRKKWLEKTGGFDLSYSRQEDVELAVRLERDCGLRFEFDMEASGIHRTIRSFESWSKIPISYAQMDAKRLKNGTLTLEEARELRKQRNFLTKLLTSFRETSSASDRLGGRFLKSLALFLYRSGVKKTAIDCLSAYYNSSYAVELDRELKKIRGF